MYSDYNTSCTKTRVDRWSGPLQFTLFRVAKIPSPALRMIFSASRELSRWIIQFMYPSTLVEQNFITFRDDDFDIKLQIHISSVNNLAKVGEFYVPRTAGFTWRAVWDSFLHIYKIYIFPCFYEDLKLLKQHTAYALAEKTPRRSNNHCIVKFDNRKSTNMTRNQGYRIVSCLISLLFHDKWARNIQHEIYAI